LAEITKQIIRIVNWAKFQHYKDRNPPWIKLHRELLISRTWLTADDASRVLAIVCMVLAAETGNKIPLDIAYIKRRAYLNQDPDFAQLVASQFIEIVDETGNASSLLADASGLHANARPETETETEAETEAEKSQKRAPSCAPTKRGTRIPDDFAVSEEHRTFASEEELPNPDSEIDAFRDYWRSIPGARGMKLDWHATFRNWLRRAAEIKRVPRGIQNGKPTLSEIVARETAIVRSRAK